MVEDNFTDIYNIVENELCNVEELLEKALHF